MKSLSDLQANCTEIADPKPTLRAGFHEEPVSGFFRHIGILKDGSLQIHANRTQLLIPAAEIWKLAASIDPAFNVPAKGK